MRRDIERLIEMLAAIDGLDLALTTNASMLAKRARALGEAGLRRVTVSLDSLDDDVFKAMNDVDFPVERVLGGIEAAAVAGLGPVKINMVLKRGTNEKSILPMARYFHGTGHIVCFIEYMDAGSTNGWRLDDIVPPREIVATIDAEMPLEPVDPNYRGQVANRYRYKDGGGEIGVIASVTQALLRELHACAHIGRGQVIHVPVRNQGSRPASTRTRRGSGPRGRGCHRVSLEGSPGPLLGGSLV